MSALPAREEALEALRTRQYLYANMEAEKVKTGLHRLSRLVSLHRARALTCLGLVYKELDFCSWAADQWLQATGKISRLRVKVAEIEINFLAHDSAHPGPQAVAAFLASWYAIYRKLDKVSDKVFVSLGKSKDRIFAALAEIKGKIDRGEELEMYQVREEDEDDHQESWEAHVGDAFEDEPEILLNVDNVDHQENADMPGEDEGNGDAQEGADDEDDLRLYD
jgi:hypothetical protein